MLLSLNGQIITPEAARLPLDDAALLYGDSLFETFRAEENRVLLQTEHLDRLCLSAQLLDFPCDRSRLEDALTQMAAALDQPCSRLRLTLGRGTTTSFQLADGHDSWYTLTAVAATSISAKERETGAACVLAPNSRSNPLDHLPQMKRGNHADCLYAADFARRHNAREALFVDQGLIIEGSSSNIFALYGETLFTPPLGKLVLGGVTRKALIATATEYGLKLKEEALPLERLYAANEVWLSNAMTELLPVASINAKPIKRATRWQEIHHLYKLRTET
ncbi:aminotransferase class IV [Geopsychrobacter electrodiphilus]|uniref:aminotransferase class IV n=1 Tax=Geopsychrobacter electrodiphilus TaxID=225196 RepID=UPI00036539C9|nr:aminotransferase class IV [Geopsychrobacter electrodiphilus]